MGCDSVLFSFLLANKNSSQTVKLTVSCSPLSPRLSVCRAFKINELKTEVTNRLAMLEKRVERKSTHCSNTGSPFMCVSHVTKRCSSAAWLVLLFFLFPTGNIIAKARCVQG